MGRWAHIRHIGFTKIAQQAHAAAVSALSHGQQGFKLLAHHLLERFGGRAIVNHAALVDHVLQAISHPCIGGQTVTACASGFLVIPFNIFGQVQVRHKAHVRLVYAHAKGNGGHHHQGVFTRKTVLVALPDGVVKTGVIRQGFYAGLTQGTGHLFNALSGLAIHNAGLARVLLLNKANQLLWRVLLVHNGVADVGPVKAADKGLRLLQMQPLHYVSPRECIRGGGQGHARHTRKALLQHAQLPVLRSEVVPPLAHTMRLVNGKKAQQTPLCQRIQERQKSWVAHPLRCGVKQYQLALQQPPLNVLRGLARQRGI